MRMQRNRLWGPQMIAALLAAGAGCSSGNLIGEVRGGAGGWVMTVDAGIESTTIGEERGDVGMVPVTPDAGTVTVTPDAGTVTVTPDAGTVTVTPDAGTVTVMPEAGTVSPVDASVGEVRPPPGCPITYPDTGFFGENILYPGRTSFVADVRATPPGQYEFAADVPLGFSLIFTITLLGGTGGDPLTGPIWYYSESDFRATAYDRATGLQTFQSRIPGRNEGIITFSGTAQGRIDYYECGSPTPTRVQLINWAPAPP
jgi:hypothetical protein